MKNISSKILLAACSLSSVMLTGCMEDVFPTDGATGEQVETSPKAVEALLYGMPAYMNAYAPVFGSSYAYAYDYGYGSMMHIRDVMTEDFAVTFHGYDWYVEWEFNQYLSEDYVAAQLVWQYYNKLVQTTNKLIGAIDEETASDTYKGYLGAGYAFRAFVYLDMARMYEFLENDGTSSVNAYGNDVLNLTVPIVTEKTTEAEARKNPRVTREKMFEFIKSDLDKAEEYIKLLSRQEKTLPDLTAVYGLKARMYMWVEDYENAKDYARKAIDTGSSYTPTTKEEWLSTTSGFNDITTPSWIWGSRMIKEDYVVQSALNNWTAWASNEAAYGYCGVGPYNCIGAAIYNKISNDDFRKLSFKAPEGSVLDGKIPYIDESLGEKMPVYAGIKFRPGSGNTTTYDVGSACSYPLMRIEEMYFIEAEAAAHSDADEGKTLLESFMKTYRYGNYQCKASGAEAVIDEIFLQKRIEFWGEGLNYFDYKRLNKPVTRMYSGTNFASDAQMNTTTRPAWMNFVIVRSEGDNNSGVRGWNNPDPSECY
ncbi:MAG: RagB/SusD family nutrient uptake outer membrane protein [Bacteroides sp.]|nr:RagB/SusD family nutrient uptake outer membrane protein [Roseburia sp.]MCM1346066.1 RagB/SusD family nutrient uptake outer membrane protein [Bacteroides sp.]MCM1420589.1 RagB/SusD family nutrient uptake outer membrane protein [Bacteroides sp.]